MPCDDLGGGDAYETVMQEQGLHETHKTGKV